MSEVGKEKIGHSSKSHRGDVINHYYNLDKKLIDESQAESLTALRRSFNPGNSSFCNTVAGWMLAESALVSTHSDKDLRLSLMTEARQDWQHSLEIEALKIKNQELHSNFLLSLQEIKTHTTIAAASIYEDMIRGDITSETRDRYHEDMLYLAVKSTEGYEHFKEVNRLRGPERNPNRFQSQYLGIAHEINATLILSRLRAPSLICTPAIIRADSGINNRNQTHDLQVLHTKWGEIKSSLGIEVKTNPKRKDYNRYDAVLIGGSVHLHPDKLRDPVYLTELLVKDQQGVASEQESRVLTAITGRVVHSIRHGFRGTTQCRNIDNCQEMID